MIDTGATRTCLTRSLIHSLGLEAKAKLLVASATSGPERVWAYGYSLGLFCTNLSASKTLYVIDREFTAPWFVDNQNFDVLLGMDIISQGRLVFEPGGDFRFEFDF